MGVNHRRADVAVSQEFLDGADVVAVFEQVNREGMAELVGRGVLGDFGRTVGGARRLLNHRLDPTKRVDCCGFMREKCVDSKRRKCYSSRRFLSRAFSGNTL